MGCWTGCTAAPAQGRAGSIIEIQVLRALAASGDETGGVGALAGAFTLACPQGYVRVFADEGAPMGVLLGRLVAAQRAEHATARSVPLSCLARVLQALSQNHAVPGSRPRAAAAVPGLVEQLTARELEILRLVAAGTPNQAIAGRLGECGQQIELQRRKPDRRAVGLYLTGIGIDDQAVEPQHGRAGLVHPPVPPQHRLDPGGDLPRAERLSRIIIRADPEPDQLVDFLGAGGHHDDVDVAEGPHMPQRLDPVDAGRHHVQQHEIRRVPADLAHRVLPVVRLGHGEPVCFQVSAQHGTDVRFVVHYEYPAHCSPRSSAWHPGKGPRSPSIFSIRRADEAIAALIVKLP